MKFLIVARDGIDHASAVRRMAVREAHIKRVKAETRSGVMIPSDTLLNDDDLMIGSACIVEVEDRAPLNARLRDEPYVTGGVRRTIEVMPFYLEVREAFP